MDALFFEYLIRRRFKFVQTLGHYILIDLICKKVGLPTLDREGWILFRQRVGKKMEAGLEK